MRIGIDARYLQNTHSGIATYLLHLILNLKKIDCENDYILFLGSNKPVPEFIPGAGFCFDVSKMPTHNQILKILWAHGYLPWAIRQKKVDVFHEPSFIPPVFKKCPTVITVHDIAYEYVPFCYTRRNRLYLRTLLARSLKQSDAVIAVSESTKDSLLENFQVSPDKIQVTHEGVDEIFRPLRDEEREEKVKQIYKIKRDFILTVSLISPRKNMVRLIKAFKLLRDNRKIDVQLVIVGEKGWLYEEVFKEVRASGLEKEVVFCGYVPREHLVCLYNAASVFAYPSLYEGFGLSVLEAFACGCPVVTSNVSSLPEVAGDAALLVDPKNIEELYSAVDRVITEDSLRKELIGRGMLQVRKFSWRKAAEKTLAIYTKINALAKHEGKIL